MMEQDAVDLCGARHGRNVDRGGYRWGRTVGKLGFHGGKVAIERPRVRARSGAPSWQAAQAEDWLGRCAMNLMLINVSTRRFGRAVRLPEGRRASVPVCRSRRYRVSSWRYRRTDESGTLNRWVTMIRRSWDVGSIDRGDAGVMGIVAAGGEATGASVVCARSCSNKRGIVHQWLAWR